MKNVLFAASVALLATAAFAQTSSTKPSGSMGSGANNTRPSTSGMMNNGAMNNGSMAKDKMSSGSMGAMNHDGMTMTQKRGKWYMGNRRATAAEVTKHKKMMTNKPG